MFYRHDCVTKGYHFYKYIYHIEAFKYVRKGNHIMKTVYLALFITLVVIIFPTFLSISWAWTVLPGFAAGVITFILMNRKYGKLVEGILQAANKEVQTAQAIMQRASQNANPMGQKAAQQAMIKKSASAVEKLKEGFAYTDWQVGSATSLNAQIGMLIFQNNVFQAAQGEKNKLKDAIPYLEASLIRGWRATLLQGLWHAWLRLAVCYFRVSKDQQKIKDVMETIVQVAKKEGFAWSVYAWFLMQTKDKDGAMDVLVRGSKDSTDPILKNNLQALQNGKALKMADYGQMWWGLGLELPKHLMSKPQSMGHPRMKGNRSGRR